MTWRELRDADLLSCLKIQPLHWGDETVGKEAALLVWRDLVRSRVFNSIVLEAEPEIGSGIFAFGASVFVTEPFAASELAHPRPGLNSRIMESVAANRSVILTEDALATSSERQAVDVAILGGSWRSNSLNAQTLSQAQMVLAYTFVDSHIGYPLRNILTETIGEVQRNFHLSSGVFQLVKHFPGTDRSLLVMTRESALAVSGSMAAKLFHYQQPVLGLRDTDKELLSEALQGGTDEEIAARIHVAVASIKKRWLSLFDRIEGALPDLLHEPNGRALRPHRGSQKRHHVLAYVRSHPQELRPYRWMS